MVVLQSMMRRVVRGTVRSVRFLAAAAAVVLLLGSTASGGVVSLTGHGPLGDYQGQITYLYQASSGLGDLTIELTNTSNPANGGYLTGFVFNIDGDARANLTANPTGSFFDVLGPEPAAPYDAFEFGAALAKKGRADGDFLSGGDSKRGLGVGQSGIFHFAVSGPAVPTLKARSFLSESRSASDGSVAVFLARFMGFNNGGSNKAPGTTTVPLPPAAWTGLTLLGMIACLKVRRRLQTA
jgi:hypothetical protein